MSDILKIIFPPIHKEGHKFIALFVIATFLFAFISDILFGIGVILTIWCYYFFRDSDRQVIQGEGLAISPADGIVCAVDEATPPAELGLGDIKMRRIGIFMNVFNGHVNRTPIAGKIEKIAYHEGQFLNASLDKASDKNERNSLTILDDAGDRYVVVQIAGLIARRIVCSVTENDTLERGERIGIIRFGSRVDIYLPEKMTPLVALHQIMVAGETIIATENLIAQPTFKMV